MPTLEAIASHLGISRQGVTAALKKIGIDWNVATMDEIRLAYIERLRKEAASHISADGLDLVAEKAQTERVIRELKTLELQEKKGELVNVEELKDDFTVTALNFKNLLLARDERLKTMIDSLYGTDIDINLLNDETYTALGALADLLDSDGKDKVMVRDRHPAGAAPEHDRVGVSQPVPEPEIDGPSGQVESHGDAVGPRDS